MLAKYHKKKRNFAGALVEPSPNFPLRSFPSALYHTLLGLCKCTIYHPLHKGRLNSTRDYCTSNRVHEAFRCLTTKYDPNRNIRP